MHISEHWFNLMKNANLSIYSLGQSSTAKKLLAYEKGQELVELEDFCVKHCRTSWTGLSRRLIQTNQRSQGLLLHHDVDTLMREEDFPRCMQIFGNFQGHFMLNTVDFQALLLCEPHTVYCIERSTSFWLMVTVFRSVWCAQSMMRK